MNLSLWLLAVTCGAGDGAAYVQPAPAAPVYSQVVYTEDAPQRPGLLPALRARLSNLRSHSSSDVVYTQMPAQTYVAPMAAPQSMQVSSAEPPQTGGVAQVSAQQLDLKVKSVFERKIGAAEDYSWITGQLFFVHVDGGVWVLRYASVDQVDKFGGSVVLAPAADMKNFREGDLVSVNGEVLDQGRASQHLGGPRYRVQYINMIERAD
jgi:hypothetical protein